MENQDTSKQNNSRALNTELQSRQLDEAIVKLQKLSWISPLIVGAAGLISAINNSWTIEMTFNTYVKTFDFSLFLQTVIPYIFYCFCLYGLFYGMSSILRAIRLNNISNSSKKKD